MENEEESSGVMDKEELDGNDEMMSNDNEKKEIIKQECKEVENNKMLSKKMIKKAESVKRATKIVVFRR